MTVQRRSTISVYMQWCASGVFVACLIAGCGRQTSPNLAKSQPAEPTSQKPVHGEQPLPASRPATQPSPATQASQPASQPEPVKPQSTYSSKPPYPVSLFVTDPDEPQPGWLKIEALADDKQLSTATGVFPEQNLIEVETGNVRRLRIHVGHLPLRPNERVVLHIDKQGMVISRDRKFTTLERRATGEWTVVKEDK